MYLGGSFAEGTRQKILGINTVPSDYLSILSGRSI
jgi:hypothetical protein